MRVYLVSVIERDEDGDDLYTDFRLFSSEKDANNFYLEILNAFMKEMKDVEFDDCLMGENKNTFTWNGSENHWEIQKSELEVA
jgi:hypothetical protein